MQRSGYAVVLSVLVVALWVGRAGQSGGQGEPRALLCGDTNGDGNLDISDAVYTLQFLFIGGPEPKCLATCNPPLGNVCDELNELKREVTARVYNSRAIEVPNDETTYLTFDSEPVDTDAMFDPAMPGRLTAQTEGTYVISGHVHYASNVAGYRTVSLAVTTADGVFTRSEIAAQTVNAVIGFGTLLSVNTTLRLARGDFIELGVRQNSGGTIEVVRDARHSPEFAMVRIR